MKLNLKVVFLSCCNLLFLNCMVTSNIAMKLYPESAYFVPLILGIITCLIYLLVPKLIENYQSAILKGYLTRILLLIYLLVSTIIIIYITFRILSYHFYFITPCYLLITITLFFVMLFGFITMKNLESITLICYITLFALTIFVIANVYNKDFRLLLPITFKFDKPYLLLGLLGLMLDNILLIFIPTETKPTSKYSLILGTIIAVIFSSWYVLDSYTFVNFQYYEGLDFPALYRYKLYYGPKYIEHLDNFLCLSICSYMFLKTLFNLELFRIYLKAKNNIFYRFFISLSIGVICIFMMYNINFKFLYFYPIILFLSVLIILIIVSLWRYKHHERTTS